MAFVKQCLPDFVGTGRELAEVNIDNGTRALEDVPLVEALPRYEHVGLVEGGGVVK